MTRFDSQRFHWNHFLINNVEDIVVFNSLIVFNGTVYKSYMFFCRRIALVTFVKKPAFLKIMIFQYYKHGYLIHTWSDNKATKYRWDSGITNLAWRYIWNYSYNPFNIILRNQNPSKLRRKFIHVKINDCMRSNTAVRFFKTEIHSKKTKR